MKSDKLSLKKNNKPAKLIHNKEKIVTIAKVGTSFGVSGQFKVHSFTDPATNICHYHNLWIRRNTSDWTPFHLSELTHQKNTTFLARTPSITSPESVTSIVNSEIGTPRSEFSTLANGEYYWEDLIDLTVKTQAGHLLGTSRRVFNCGANDIIEVSGEKTHLIPYINEVILQVNLEEQLLIVQWDPDFITGK